MKKISFLLTIACVIMVMGSCKNESSYIINGTAEGCPDGTTVYLQMRDKPEWISVDSATVENGKFRMEGQVSPGFLGFIGIGEEHTMIVVEDGEITIDLKDGNPHGTECNERLSEMNKTMKELDAKMEVIMEKIENLDPNDSATYVQYGMELEELDNQEMELLSKTITENIKNPLGVGLYCIYYSAFAEDVDFLFGLSQQIPEEYLQQNYVAKVLENVSIIQCTSVGYHFTDLMMTTREGEEVSLESLVQNNKYVLIDFWASWCAPCRQMLPGIKLLYDNYKDKGLCIVGISLDDNKEAWEAAIERYQMEWIQVSELHGWDSEHAAAYGVRAIPSTILIDNSGMIIGRNIEAAEVAEIIDNADKDE